MAVLTVQKTSLSGLSPTFATASASGDSFPNDGETLLRVKNTGAGSVDVTFVGARKCSQGFIHDEVVSVSAGGEETIGPFTWSRFNDDQQRVSVTYADATNLSVAAIKLGD